MAIAIVAQGESLESSGAVLRPTSKHQKGSKYTQSAADQWVHSVTVWTRWWRIATRFLGLIFQRKAWGVIGAYLKKEKAPCKDRPTHSDIEEELVSTRQILDAIKAQATRPGQPGQLGSRADRSNHVIHPCPCNVVQTMTRVGVDLLLGQHSNTNQDKKRNDQKMLNLVFPGFGGISEDRLTRKTGKQETKTKPKNQGKN